MVTADFFELLTDCFIDTVRLFPFLFLVYVLMEYLEHRSGEKTERLIKNAGSLGPLFGGLLGMLPQCGFSAAAAGLYTGGILTAGSLLAVFLSTSDEMLPVLLSKGMAIGLIVKILCLKAFCAMISGFLVDLSHIFKKPDKEITDLCEEADCHCEEKSIFASALHHSLQIMVFLFIISLLAGMLILLIGEERIMLLSSKGFIIGQMIAGLVGLIPNCAISVLLTGLYVDGVISGGILFSGLLVSAGVGILTLIRLNHDRKENIKLLAVLYVLGVFWGVLIDLFHII